MLTNRPRRTRRPATKLQGFPNRPPTCSLVSDFATGVAPFSLTLTATAADPDGPINKVDFYDGAGLIGTVFGPGPHVLAVSGLPVGLHNFTAIARDSDPILALSTTSNIVSVTVTQAAGTPANVARDTFGSVATASSTYSANFPPSGAINGDRKGLNWGAGGGWNANTLDVWGDTLTVMFAGGTPQTINRMVVCGVQDNYTAPIEPSLSTTFSLYGLIDFVFQYCTNQAGTVWATPAGGTITGNNKVMRDISFTSAVAYGARVTVNNAGVRMSRVVEFEVWSASDPTPPNIPPNISITTDASSYTFPASPRITATATDGDGAIAKIEIYRGVTLIDTVLLPPPGPYIFNDSTAPEGTYAYSAKAYDNGTAITTSNAVNVFVAAGFNPNESQEGTRRTVFADGSGGWIKPASIIDANGDVWTFGNEDLAAWNGNFQTLKNGVQVGTVGGDNDRQYGWGMEYVYASHRVAYKNTRGSWYQWNGTAFVYQPFGDPSLPLLLATNQRTTSQFATIQEAIDDSAFASGDTLLCTPGVRPRTHQFVFRKGSLTLKTSDTSTNRLPGQWYGYAPIAINLDDFNYLANNVKGMISIYTTGLATGIYNVTLYNPVLSMPIPQYDDASANIYPVSDGSRGLYLKIIDGFITGGPNGILGPNYPCYATTFEFDGTWFDRCGSGGQSHGFYLGQPDAVILKNVWSTRNVGGGHLGKSRARNTTHINCHFGGDINGDFGGGESAVFDFCGAGNILLQDSTYVKSANNDAHEWWFYLGREAFFTNSGSLPIDHTGYNDRFKAERCLFVDYGPGYAQFIGMNFGELNFFSTFYGGPPAAWQSIEFWDCIFAGPRAQQCYDYLVSLGAIKGTGNKVVPLSEIVRTTINERPKYRWAGALPNWRIQGDGINPVAVHTPFFIPNSSPNVLAGHIAITADAINAYGGMAPDRIRGDAHLGLIGGHAAHQYSGILTFKAQQDPPTWVVSQESSPQAADTVFLSTFRGFHFDDGSPASRHTYGDSFIAEIASNPVMMFSKSSATTTDNFPDGSSNQGANGSYNNPHMDSYHFTSHAWDPPNTRPPFPGTVYFEAATCYDHVNKNFYSSGPSGHYRYSVANDAWTFLSSTFVLGNVEGMYDSLRNRIVYTGQPSLRGYVQVWNITTESDGGFIQCTGPGAVYIGNTIHDWSESDSGDYDPDNDCFLISCRSQAVLVKMTPTGFCTVIANPFYGSNGSGHRFKYFPTLKAFLGIVRWDVPVYCVPTV